MRFSPKFDEFQIQQINSYLKMWIYKAVNIAEFIENRKKIIYLEQRKQIKDVLMARTKIKINK